MKGLVASLRRFPCDRSSIRGKLPFPWSINIDPASLLQMPAREENKKMDGCKKDRKPKPLLPIIGLDTKYCPSAAAPRPVSPAGTHFTRPFLPPMLFDSPIFAGGLLSPSRSASTESPFDSPIAVPPPVSLAGSYLPQGPFASPTFTGGLLSRTRLVSPISPLSPFPSPLFRSRSILSSCETSNNLL